MNVNFHTTQKFPTPEMTTPNKEVLDYFLGNPDSKLQIFEDKHFQKVDEYDDSYIKVAWYRECPDIYAYSSIFSDPYLNPYWWIRENHEKFDYVISAFKDLGSVIGKEKFLYAPTMGSRILPENYGIYEKNKMVSIVASEKDWTMGHRLRHLVIQQFRGQIDVFGRGYNTIIDDAGEFGKIYALAPYYFSLAIMNAKNLGDFTEVLTDCIAVGTMPIFYGAPDVVEYFNPDGILQFSSLPELKKIMDSLSPELYNSRIDAIKENLEISKKYLTHIEYTYGEHKPLFDRLIKEKLANDNV